MPQLAFGTGTSCMTDSGSNLSAVLIPEENQDLKAAATELRASEANYLAFSEQCLNLKCVAGAAGFFMGKCHMSFSPGFLYAKQLKDNLNHQIANCHCLPYVWKGGEKSPDFSLISPSFPEKEKKSHFEE